MPGTSRIAASLKWAARLAIGLGLTAYLVWRFDYAKVASGILAADPLLFAAAVAVLFAGVYAYAAVHKVCLPPTGLRFSTAALFRVILVVRFYGLFLPGSTAASAVQWYKLSQPDGRRAQAAALLIFTRILYLVVLLALSCVGLALDAQLPIPQLRTVAVILLVLSLAASFALFVPQVGRLIERLLALAARSRCMPARWVQALDNVSQSVQAFRTLSVPALLLAFALTAFSQLADAVAFWFLARAVSLDLSFALLLWIRSVGIIAAFLPVTIGGLGLREAGFAALLRSYGATSAAAVGFSLLVFSLTLILGLVGGLLEAWQVFGPPARRAPPAQPPGDT